MSSLSGARKLSGSVCELSRRPWSIVCGVCRDAAVFVDDGAAELLHWAGGVKLLEGCVGVYDLHSQLSPVARDFIAAAPYCHVVIVVCDFLHGVISKQISRLLSDLQPLECHVYCSQTEEMHAQLIPMTEGEGLDYSLGGYSHFGEFQALMRKWINREAGVRVSVQHLPLFCAEVCPGLVTTPPYSTFFPLVPSSIIDIQSRLLSEGVTDSFLENLNQVDFNMLTRQLQTSIKGFASGLNTLLTEWGLVEDVFSMGTTSRFIANQLATMPAAKVRRKASSRQCSLVLVDRTLDLTNPSLHHADSLASKILSLLPHTPSLSSDVSVSMAPLSSTPKGWALNGSLAQPHHPRAKQLLKTLICSKQKECLMEVSRSLLDCLSQEGLSVKMSGKLARPSALQLKTFIQQFKDHPQACVSQHAVLQLACAVVQAMEGDTGKHWDRLASTEKVLLMSLHDEDAPSIVAQLSQEVRKQALSKDVTPLTLVELVGVAVAMFSLMGADTCLNSSEEETELKEAFSTLAKEWRSCDQPFLESLGMSQSDSHADVVGQFESMLQRLEGLGTARDHLSQFRQLYCPEAPTPLPYRSLLPQVMEAIFDTSRPDLPDLCYHSQATVTNILKSGFSLFVGSARPRPNQHPLLLLFVVGGVSCSEVRQIREVVGACKTEVEVIVGTTRLVTPQDITTQLLKTQS